MLIYSLPFLEQWQGGSPEWLEPGVAPSTTATKVFSEEEKKLILEGLTRAEALERFLHVKHVGKKRFSLEGEESLIPMLLFLLEACKQQGVEAICMGMSHRGRLNVLANVLRKPLESVLSDFDEEGDPFPSSLGGDVRYHKGFANETVWMASNASHLESVMPIVEGQAKAKQRLLNDPSGKKVLPLLLHGDAAFCGQGIVYETLQMSRLKGFSTGGTLHIILNNQIGFTTPPEEGRSTTYCTDIAKAFDYPVFRVQAQEPESCVEALLKAFQWRMEKGEDVFIDLQGYRKYGHNEGDEPSFTQPVLYQQIGAMPSIRTLYVEQNPTLQSYAEGRLSAFKEELEKSFQVSSSLPGHVEAAPATPFKDEGEKEALQKVASLFKTVPEGFHLHPKVQSLFEARSTLQNIDWGGAELLAYGYLLSRGIPVRVVGQDVKRGTFSHRHAVWFDQKTGKPHLPLPIEIYNTVLSEAASLGFEYGYSTFMNRALTVWEAQFGDFANSAQVIIDQYLAAGEEKWGQHSNLTLFLPHGYEGQGPEHSSARIERFLSMEGLRCVQPSTPGQFYGLLKAQPFMDKPLVIFTPKALLRHPACVSRLEELEGTTFQPWLDDLQASAEATALFVCSGRLYYDLKSEKEKRKRSDVALIRLEQLAPFDGAGWKAILARYPRCKKVLWVQEEPKNMGAWPSLMLLSLGWECVARKPSAAPATGSAARHRREQQQLLEEAFA